MRTRGVFAGLMVATVTATGGVAVAPGAHASNFGVELTGTYQMVSDGEYARTNGVFSDEQTETQIWTGNTTCITAIDCTGTVTSDKGWTASARLNDYWYVEHDIANWAPCPDGTFADGHQMFLLVMWNPDTEERSFSSKFMQGRNITKTASGACGRNQPLVIELPMSIRRIS